MSVIPEILIWSNILPSNLVYRVWYRVIWYRDISRVYSSGSSIDGGGGGGDGDIDGDGGGSGSGSGKDRSSSSSSKRNTSSSLIEWDWGR